MGKNRNDEELPIWPSASGWHYEQYGETEHLFSSEGLLIRSERIP
jgi:hypothetical protein